jgi:fibronectin type 3 domain-containing protein
MPSLTVLVGAAAVMLAALASADTVTLTDNGNGTVTMANAEVSMTFSKADGSVSSVIAAGMPGVNLMDASQDYALSLTHIGSGTNDYWVSIDSPGVPNYIVVTNTGQIVDVMLDNPVASGNASLWPNGIWDWQEHHVMRAGESGFYTYHVWRHTASMPQSYYTADSWQGRANAFFSCAPNADGTTSDAWSFSGSDVPIGLSIGGNPPGSTSAGVPGEVVIMPYTNYFTQPIGAYYEPGWPIYTQPCGLTSALYPTWTKYDWSSYEGPSNSARNTWGMATDQVGLWSILGSFEFVNGGPTKLKGAVSGNYMYNDDVEGHGLGADIDNPGVPAGAVWTKLIGPFFMYVNTGTNHMQLWQDATNMGAHMVSNWPYAWVNETEQVYPRHRGTVTGTIKAKTGESTSNAVVILGNSTYTNWLWQGGTNFLFWTTADSNGNFTIPKVRPDTYVLFCDVPGIWGEIQLSNIVVTAGQTNNLGVINWNPPHLQQRLWRVGTPDHSSKEFRFGNLPKQYGLWWRYLNEMGESNLNFTIGQSVESNDWYYAQPEVWTTPQSGANLTDHTQTNFTAWSPVWNIIFDLTNLPTTSVLCTVALAGCNGCYFYPYINGVNQTPNIPNFSNPSQGVFTTSGDDIYRDVVEVGRYQYYQFTFPNSDFVVGTNTFSIHIRQPGTDPLYSISNVTNGYPDLLVGGLIYDFLQMETGPPVVMQNLPTSPTGLTATAASGCEIDLAWANTATNATGVVIERSADDVHFAQVGAAASTSNSYADTSLSPGTHYYYEVLANNVDGNSPASNVAQATTQAAEPPAVPSALLATAGSMTQINLQWDEIPNDADGFTVERATNGANYAVIGTTTAEVTNYSDIGLTAGTTYFYRVQAFRNCWGASAFASPIEVTTEAPPPPPAPGGLVAIPGNASVALSWVAVSGAGGYDLQRSTVSGGSYVTIDNTVGSNYVDTGRVNGTTYFYVVAATNGSGASANSRQASATPVAAVTAYWTNRAISTAQSWNANANWTNTATYPNGPDVVAVINADITTAQTVNLNSATAVGWLDLGDADASSAYTVAPNGGTLTFVNGLNSAGLVELPTSAGDTITIPIILSNNLTVLNRSPHTLTMSGTISGTNQVEYVGAGLISLTASNHYSGGTLISGATVDAANFNVDSNGFGTGPITLDQGTLNLYSDTLSSGLGNC